MNARELIDKLRASQMKEYTHEEFMQVLRHRIRRWNGDESIMFATEQQVVEKLMELNVINRLGNLQP